MRVKTDVLSCPLNYGSNIIRNGKKGFDGPITIGVRIMLGYPKKFGCYILGAVLDASTTVYTTSHYSSAPNGKIIPVVSLGCLLFRFKFFWGLWFL
jgi:hypothetical protein